MNDKLPPITDDIPENELEAEPDHIAINEHGEAVDDPQA